MGEYRNSSAFSYIGAVVLGMNDALVEMTGALAGFTMVLENNRLIALTGLTTGVAATLSMAVAEFFAQEAEAGAHRPIQAALCTGVAYLLTVGLLLAPYFLFSSPWLALAVCLLLATLLILAFTWSVARCRRTRFFPAFKRMVTISFAVAFAAFAISWLARLVWGVDV